MSMEHWASLILQVAISGVLGFAAGYTWRRDKPASIACWLGVVGVTVLGAMARA